MTAKELKRLRRSDLMEMLLELSRENLDLRQQLQEANQKLDERQLDIQQAGSLAEAALRLNHIFEDAQAACDQYELNVRQRCQQMEQDTRRKCEQLEADARRRCAAAPAQPKQNGSRQRKGKHRGKAKH